MNACGYTVIFMFGMLTTINISEIVYVICKFTNWSAGFYVTSFGFYVNDLLQHLYKFLYCDSMLYNFFVSFQ